MVVELNRATLQRLDSQVAVPGYDPSRVAPGIAHIGVGSFHRSHQAVVVDRLLATDPTWAIRGIGLLEHDRAVHDALRQQDHLYTVVAHHPDGRVEPRVVGSIVEHLLGTDDREAVVAGLADPAIRIITMTITEGGYDDHGPAADVLVDTLARRRAQGAPVPAVVSCDNVVHNGGQARELVLRAALRRDGDLSAWIAEHVAFPNSMVDRITPVTTDGEGRLLVQEFGVVDRWPVPCEPHLQWIIEDRFPSGRPRFEDAGVLLVEDVTPYETMKLRLLNAGHQLLGHLGLLADLDHVHHAATDPHLRRLLVDFWRREARPTLAAVPGIDLDTYCRELVERFANPHIADTLTRLCTDASDRVPAFLLPVVRDQLRSGGEVHRSALCVAAWALRLVRAASGRSAEPITDQRRDLLLRAATDIDSDPAAFLRRAQVFGVEAAHPVFVDTFVSAFVSLSERGVRETLLAYP